jgi:hypothetical protein
MTPEEAKNYVAGNWNATSHMRDCYDKSYWKAS